MLGSFQALREGLVALVKTAIHEALKNDVRTTVPGHILEFDPATQQATLQVGIQRVNVDGKTITPPPIVTCPMCIYGGTGGVIEVEIQQGDEVLIHFSMRCIEGWQDQGGVAPLVRTELFRYADAFAVLAPRSQQHVVKEYTNEGMKLRSLDGKRYVWLKNDGSIEAKNEKGAHTVDADGLISSINDNGNVTLKADGSVDANGAQITTGGNVITASGTDLDAFKADYDNFKATHTHTGDNGGTTSPPL